MATLGSAQVKDPQRNRQVGRQHQSSLILLGIGLIFFGGIASRLAYLQIDRGKENQLKAKRNHTLVVPKPPIRGNIYDRNGKVLATTKLTHAAYIWSKAQKQEDWLEIRDLLATILQVSAADIQKRVEEAGVDYPSLIPLALNLNPSQVTALEEYRPQLKWVETEVNRIRYYPRKELAAHIIGYTGELDSEELKQKSEIGYRLGDVVGKMGVEKFYEQNLRGKWGGLNLDVNGEGKVIRIVGEDPPEAGNDLTLTLDLDLQAAAESVLGKRKGSIVVLNPHDGSVLAMASYPRFDPNIFSKPISNQDWQKLQSDGNPFLNLALRGFPPASTFKVVTAAAGMESGRFPPNQILNTFPYIELAGIRFREWNRKGFGRMGYVGALAWSSNTFFGQIGQSLGGKNLSKWANNFGFGEPTGLDLAGETGGLIADDAWKRKTFKQGWTTGDTINMSIGQGFVLATPLQVGVMLSAIANDGHKITPHLLKSNPQAATKPPSLNLKPGTLKTIKKGLRAVVSRGTGDKLNVPSLPPAAGKSGTAEAPPGEPHTWFMAYAPYAKPEIVVVAFAEHSGGGGSSVAAPMVQKVMGAYFKHKELRKPKSKPKPQPNKSQSQPKPSQYPNKLINHRLIN